jgi:hypothetical protein
MARLVVLWALLPLTLISAGSSKLLHYSYPFVPPLFLGVGLVAAIFIQAAWWVAGFLVPAGRRLAAITRASVTPQIVRRGLAAVAIGALVVAGATWWMGGRLQVDVGRYELLRNSSVARPLIAGVVLLALIGYTQEILRSAFVFVLILALPLNTYTDKLRKTASIDMPLHALRDCMVRELAAGRAKRPGVYVDDRAVMSHQFFYYLKPTGPYETEFELEPMVRERLFGNTESQTPVLTSRPAYLALRADFGKPINETLPEMEAAAARRHVLDSGLIFFDGQVIIIPPVYARCRDLAVTRGGTPLQSVSLDRPQ